MGPLLEPGHPLEQRGVVMAKHQQEAAVDVAAINHVHVQGRVSSGPEARELPSGSSVVSLRLSLSRAESPMTKGSKQTVDWVDCAAWGSSQRRAALRWKVGDVVAIEGALRRRVSRGPHGMNTRLEVEILSGQRVLRSD